ncbi:MAG TPA: gluconeogenesis factor YvcK family protein [Candidatus Saccharimonadaceae bacterium]|nr:gluconeogenesis factor YvcK family protein [Candidatus Saccharimonadaceae bacterium]
MDKIGVNIVVIGGGTGSFTLLSALKNYTRHVTALVNMADDGGSTGQLRDELGVLPAGDVRQCLVALSESPRTRDLFNYRFAEGTFAGHAFGNIFMAALEKMTGNFAEAVEEASRVLNIIGRVEPVTLDEVTLVLTSGDGSVTRGEFQIGHMDFGSRKRPTISLDPLPKLNPRAAAAIERADIVVVAPGNLYGSLAPALVVPGMSEALRSTSAKRVYVANLVTKPGQTDGFTVSDFADEVERFGRFKLDYVLYNTAKPDKKLLAKYAKEGELPVEYDLKRLKQQHFKAKGGEFLSNEFVAFNSGKVDPIASTRTLIRHDADAIARALMKLYFS